jgi:hypothetical protein
MSYILFIRHTTLNLSQKQLFTTDKPAPSGANPLFARMIEVGPSQLNGIVSKSFLMPGQKLVMDRFSGAEWEGIGSITPSPA